MDFSLELANAIKKASTVINDSEKLMLPLLAVRARKAAKEYSDDVTLVSAANVLSRMEENGKIFITTAELKSMYKNLYTRNTKFAEVFTEVGPSQLSTPTFMQHSETEGQALELNVAADKTLSNALNNIFDKDAVHKPYSNEIATKAEQACLQELNSIGAPPKKVSVFAGQSDFIVCMASYETPSGMSDILVPVEVNGDKVLLPTIFLSRAGFLDIRLADIKAHIVSTAGKSYTVDGESLLNALSTAKFGAPEELSEVDRAIIKANANKETPAYTANGITYQEVDAQTSTIEAPHTAETQTFASKMNTVKGAASFLFGDKVVNAGRDMVQRFMTSFGFKNVQVAVADTDDNNIFYAVSLGGNGLKVPVAVKNGQVEPPQVVLSAGNMYEFSKTGIQKVLASGSKDARMMSVVSPMYELKPSDLIKEIKAAMTDSNYSKAEDALNVLASKGDEVAYYAGLAAYMGGLDMSNGLTKQASKLEEYADVPLLISNTVVLTK